MDRTTRYCKFCKVDHPITDFYIIRRKGRNDHHACAARSRERGKNDIIRNNEKINKRRREKHILRQPILLAQKSKYREANREQLVAKQKIYAANNPERYKALRHKRRKEKKYEYIWRNQLKRILRVFGKEKEDTTINILGYSALQFKSHIESLFQPGMSWDNYGHDTWHIDHIRELRTFSSDTHPSIVNALPNLRPLWANENYARNRKNYIEKELIS